MHPSKPRAGSGHPFPLLATSFRACPKHSLPEWKPPISANVILDDFRFGKQCLCDHTSHKLTCWELLPNPLNRLNDEPVVKPTFVVCRAPCGRYVLRISALIRSGERVRSCRRRFAPIGAKNTSGEKAKGGIAPALAVVVSLFIFLRWYLRHFAHPATLTCSSDSAIPPDTFSMPLRACHSANSRFPCSLSKYATIVGYRHRANASRASSGIALAFLTLESFTLKTPTSLNKINGRPVKSKTLPTCLRMIIIANRANIVKMITR